MRYEVELMYHYFASRTSQVILVVVETFLDLTIESREFILSLIFLGLVKNSTFSLIEMHLMKKEWVRVVGWTKARRFRCLIK